MPDSPGSPAARSRRGRLVTVARILLGLVFLASGVAGLVMTPPAPTSPPMRPGMVALFTGLVGSGYLLPLLKATEAAVGAALLANRFVPLALTVLAPITVNIVAVHLLLAPEGLPVAAVVLAFHLFLAWSYRDVFRPVLAARA
jgi:uncharacterized membrane protein YphA (DoxX/SURF4 family)